MRRLADVCVRTVLLGVLGVLCKSSGATWEGDDK